MTVRGAVAMLDLANGPAIGPAAYAGGSARLNLSGTGGPGTLSTRAMVGCNAPCLVPVLEGDGHRRRAHRWARARSRRDVREARAGAPGPLLLDRAADAERPRRAEEAAQDAFVRAYRALSGYDATRILELRLRPWLATIVLNLCRTRLARRATAGRGAALARRRSRAGDAAGAGRDGPVDITDGGRGTASRPGPLGRPPCDPAARLPGRRRPATRRRPVLSRSRPRPRTTQGTVKAQVHRGLAMLRTAFETANRLEREEMTA